MPTGLDRVPDRMQGWVPAELPAGTAAGVPAGQDWFTDDSFDEEDSEKFLSGCGSVPQASAVCLNSTRSFGELQFMNCVWTLENLQDIVNASDTSVDKNWLIASSVQMLTSRPEQLTHENITSAATIARRLLSSNLLNKTIALAVVTTISQLMDAAHSQYSEDSYTAIENLTKTLEDFALHMSMNDTTSGGLVQPNLAIQYIKVPSGTPQVRFYTLTGPPETFLGLGTEAADTRSSSGYPAEIQLTLHLQKDVQKNWENRNVGIGVVMYKNDHFFKSKSFNMQIGTKRRVVSASLTDKRILDHIKFNIMPKNISGVTPHSSACVFWDYTERHWSTEGCNKILTPSGGVECKCNHTTNFAVLMSYKADYQYSEALNWISILGCSMSLVGLVLTVLYQIQTRKSRGTNSTVVLVNICVCMTVFYLIFMFAINNPVQHKDQSKSLKNVVPASDWYQELDEGPCTPVTALLQYFLLATFTWNIMYAAHVFFLIRNAVNGPPAGFLAFAITAGWGLPALIVGISLGTTYSFKDPLGYRQEEFCWLASLDKEGRFDPKRPMLWGFLLPLAVMLSFNIVVLVYFSLTICCAKPNLKSSRMTPLKKKILSSFSLAVVLGLSWVIGYFVLITHDKTLYIILSALFCLCNTTQGVQICVFFTLKPFLQKKAHYNTDLKTESKMVP
ncbi:adhesion G-protein coupled receptor G7-like [Triplophysa rosa]|uniref:adhesion G-protein coupled receptor G7-like n=1 Tax=Triplophysa rosa TaxID=992332 RepID=UPI002545FEB3|nr:adhesion G-protein coupled receptor G7-like [Triplophysa rosa]